MGSGIGKFHSLIKWVTVKGTWRIQQAKPDKCGEKKPHSLFVDNFFLTTIKKTKNKKHIPYVTFDKTKPFPFPLNPGCCARLVNAIKDLVLLEYKVKNKLKSLSNLKKTGEGDALRFPFWPLHPIVHLVHPGLVLFRLAEGYLSL